MIRKEDPLIHALNPEVSRNKGRAVDMIMVCSPQRIAQRNPKGKPLSMPTEKVAPVAGKPAPTDKCGRYTLQIDRVFSVL